MARFSTPQAHQAFTLANTKKFKDGTKANGSITFNTIVTGAIDSGLTNAQRIAGSIKAATGKNVDPSTIRNYRSRNNTPSKKIQSAIVNHILACGS